jgi:hypothetical protein
MNDGHIGSSSIYLFISYILHQLDHSTRLYITLEDPAPDVVLRDHGIIDAGKDTFTLRSNSPSISIILPTFGSSANLGDGVLPISIGGDAGGYDECVSLAVEDVA